jgi:hypothetical protein
VLIERQNSWNYGCSYLRQCICCNDGIWQQELNIVICFVVLCAKGFTCSAQGCVLNGTLCNEHVKYDDQTRASILNITRSARELNCQKHEHEKNSLLVYLGKNAIWCKEIEPRYVFEESTELSNQRWSASISGWCKGHFRVGTGDMFREKNWYKNTMLDDSWEKQFYMGMSKEWIKKDYFKQI